MQVIENIQPECSICLDTIIDDSKTLDCSHIFHHQCIKNWVDESLKFTCPLCRSGMITLEIKSITEEIITLLFENKEIYIQFPDCVQIIEDLNIAIFEGDHPTFRKLRHLTIGIICYTLYRNDNDIEKAKKDVTKILKKE
jgi:hypothetical protein